MRNKKFVFVITLLCLAVVAVSLAGCSLSGEDPWKMAEMLIRDVCDQVGLPAAEAD